MSVVFSHSQRPKTEAQTCQLAVQIPQTIMPQKLVKTIETPTIIGVLDLTQVKGIGEKRAKQLKITEINSFDYLAKASTKDATKKWSKTQKTR